MHNPQSPCGNYELCIIKLNVEIQLSYRHYAIDDVFLHTAPGEGVFVLGVVEFHFAAGAAHQGVADAGIFD